MEGPPINKLPSERFFNIPLTNKSAIFTIIILGILVFGNILFNGFALDDTSQILTNTPVHSLTNITSFFRGSTFGPDISGSETINGAYYKPLLTVFYAILYTFSGGNAFIFHLFQLMIYIINTILVFYLFSRFFSRNISFLLSLLFLVHPINVETVANIASLQDILFLFFGMLSLTIIIRNYEKHKSLSTGKYALIIFLLLCSLLSKESGLLFIIILPVYGFLLLKKFDRWILLASFSALAIYLLLRFYVGHVYFSTQSLSPIAELPLSQRLINIPAIIFYYLKTFILPIHLITQQTWVISTIAFSNFDLPLIAELFFLLLIIFLGSYIHKKHSHIFKIYLFFIMWFFIGLLMHLQLFPLDMTVADRWFYFPLIGLLGIIGVILTIFFNSKKAMPALTIICIVLIIILGIRSIVRNSNWNSTYTITSHDIVYEENNSYLQNTLALEYQGMGNQKAALQHFQIAYSLEPESAILSNIALSLAYEGNIRASVEVYAKLLKTDPKYYPTYINLAHILLKANDPKDALEICIKGLEFYPKNEQLWILAAFSEYKIGDVQLAIYALTKGYGLNHNIIFLQYESIVSHHQSIDSYL